MNVGALRNTVGIYEKDSEQAESGYIDPEPKLLYTVKATRLHTSDREVWEAYAAKVRTVVNWKIRARPGIRAGMLLKCGDDWFEIIDPQPLPGAPRYMRIKTALKEAK